MKGISTIGILCIALNLTIHASPVIYTLTGTGNGYFGGSQFSNKVFTITSTAETADIINSQIPYSSPQTLVVPDNTAKVSVPGIGSADFTIPTLNFINPQSSAFGISETNLLDILDITNSALASYDLSSSFGPLTGSPVINARDPYETTAGYFSLFYVSSVTFQANVVPEPKTLTLIGVALVMLGLWREKRKYMPPNTALEPLIRVADWRVSQPLN